MTGALPFTGADIWTAYELTWLDPHGKPQVAIATFVVPVASPSIVESKSVKLYLGSFAQTRFDGTAEVRATIERDLAHGDRRTGAAWRWTRRRCSWPRAARSSTASAWTTCRWRSSATSRRRDLLGGRRTRRSRRR